MNSPLKIIALSHGAFLSLPGRMVLIDWYGGPLLIQISSSFVPMQCCPALGFFVCGGFISQFQARGLEADFEENE